MGLRLYLLLLVQIMLLLMTVTLGSAQYFCLVEKKHSFKKSATRFSSAFH